MTIHISELNLFEWNLTDEQISYMSDNNLSTQDMVDTHFNPDTMPEVDQINDIYYRAEEATSD